MDDLDRTLERAIKILHSGQPLPLDLASILMERGYDIHELERKHAA